MQNSTKLLIFTLLVILLPFTHGVGNTSASTLASDSLVPQCNLLEGNISFGSTAPNVRVLQQVLNASTDTRVALSGVGSPGNETSFFGALTKSAVIRFQEKYRSDILIPAGVTSGTGFVRAYTLQKLRAVCSEIVLARASTVAPSTESTTMTQTVAITPLLVSPTTTKSPTVAASTVQEVYVGVCGTTVDTCEVGTYKSRTDTSTKYRWVCRSSRNRLNTSCSLPKNATTPPPIVVPTTTPISTPTISTCSAFTYSSWSSCQSNNTQTRTVLSFSPSGCTGGTPVVSQSCTYVPPAPTVVTCSTFTYSAWGSCQANSTQTRTVTSSSPSGCTGGSPVKTQSCTYVPPAPTVPTTPTGGALLWGAFPGNSATQLTSFETMVGKPVQLRSAFLNWSDNFPITSYADVKASGKTLVLFWEQYGVTLDSIIAGQSDAYITKFATDLKTYGGPVFLAPFHEMNGNWDPWGGAVSPNTPAKVVAAWKHVKDVFGTVSNVKFAWTVNNGSVPNTPENAITAYYPGSAYVDIVGIDGFNSGNPWQTFEQAFKPALTTVAQYNKPIYILSMASEAGTGKAAWITDAVKVQMPKYPLLKGWVWFNESKSHNWRIDSDPTSLAAFKSVIQ